MYEPVLKFLGVSGPIEGFTVLLRPKSASFLPTDPLRSYEWPLRKPSVMSPLLPIVREVSVILPKNLGVYPPGAISFIKKQLGSAIIASLVA